MIISRHVRASNPSVPPPTWWCKNPPISTSTPWNRPEIPLPHGTEPNRAGPVIRSGRLPPFLQTRCLAFGGQQFPWLTKPEPVHVPAISPQTPPASPSLRHPPHTEKRIAAHMMASVAAGFDVLRQGALGRVVTTQPAGFAPQALSLIAQRTGRPDPARLHNLRGACFRRSTRWASGGLLQAGKSSPGARPPQTLQAAVVMAMIGQKSKSAWAHHR